MINIIIISITIVVNLRMFICCFIMLQFGSWSKKNETSPFDRCLFLEWGVVGFLKMVYLQWQIWSFKKLLEVVKKEYIY